ncbi:MAG TPA: acyl-CoA dehydrogenase family protein [Hydrogenophaga sp.]
MPIDTIGEPANATPNALNAPTPPSPLERVVATGLLRCAVPPSMGGNGGNLDDLSQAAQALKRDDPQAATVLWAQRLAIEALVQSPNVGLRELWLPELFSGERAGTLPIGEPPLVGKDTGRGWLLSGRFEGLSNLPWEGFSLVAPVCLGPSEGWVFLRSEENGLSVHPGQEHHASDQATLKLSQVYFREDEWLGDAELSERIVPLAFALGACRPRLSTSTY